MACKQCGNDATYIVMVCAIIDGDNVSENLTWCDVCIIPHVTAYVGADYGNDYDAVTLTIVLL